MIAALLALALQAPAPPPARPDVAPSGAFASPEGYRAQLPAGFTYRRSTEGGRTTWSAISRREGAAVAITASQSEAPLRCEPAGSAGGAGEDEEGEGDEELGEEGSEGEAPDDGVHLEPFDVEGGDEACLIGKEVEQGGLVIAAVRRGTLLVTVSAIATGPGAATRLARAVGRSVRFDGAGRAGKAPKLAFPEADPRLVGCFERTVSSPGGSAFGTTRRCFREDFTFTQQHRFNVIGTDLAGSPDGTLATGKDEARVAGIWWLEGETLTLQYDGAGPREHAILFLRSGIALDEKPWESAP